MTSFPDKTLIAELTASMLIEVEAVHFRADEPFRLTSGMVSPVYIDCRKLISYPRLRTTLMDFAASVVLREIGFESLDAVAGGETAGIPFAAWLADRLSLPMQYVRKQPKGFGRGAQIEGAFKDGARTLLVEDLASDAGSKAKFCEAMRKAGMQVDHAFVVFYYDIFPRSRQTLADLGLELHWLASWWDVLKVARGKGYFDDATLSAVEDFLHGPDEWSRAHGGATPASGS
ncbi:orotate phosphoribosyltransferase [Consotaella aegiceratis]|uniref:orotate phosphoribosyltransferase n=1 Tax=Consotaella aegiceratis TaxID=3097961 RepID=UPI002F40658A